MNLYPDQLQAKRDVYAAWRVGYQAPILVANTGFGKTHVAASIVADVESKSKRTLFVADREELINQADERFQEFGIKPGIIMGDRKMDLSRLTQIASIDTLRHRMDLLGAFDLIVPDESHLTCSTRYRKLFARYPTVRRLGLTGTPERLDGQGLGIHSGGFFDTLVGTPSKRELIRMGRIPDYRFFAPDDVDTTGLRTEFGDYEKRGAAERVKQPQLIGSIARHYHTIGQGAPAVFFAADIAHAELIAEQIRASGYQCVAVSGKSPRALRRDSLLDLASGKLNAVVNVDLWVQGMDCKPISYVGLCLLTMSVTKYLQEVGRADRIYGEKVSTIVDHANCWRAHGLPGDEREWSLDGRRKKAKDTGVGFSVHRCAKCYAVVPIDQRVCLCGEKFATACKARRIEVADKTLREIEVEAEEMAAKQRRMQQGMARDRDALIAMGYSPGRADHVIAGRLEAQELRRQAAQLRIANGLSVRGIDSLKPKALREEIASLSGRLVA